MLKEEADDVLAAGSRGFMERSAAAGGEGFGVGTAGEDGLGVVELVFGGGVVEWRPAILIEDVWFGTCLEEGGGDGGVVAIDGEVERSAKGCVCGIGVGSGGEEEFRDFGFVAEDGLFERWAGGGLAALFCAGGIGGDVAFDIIEVAFGDGEVDGFEDGGGGGFSLDSGGWDVGVCGPCDGVEEECAEVGVVEVLEVVAAGEAEATGSGGGILFGPGEYLGFVVGEFAADFRVCGARAIGTQRGSGWERLENGSDIGLEADVVVEFLFDFERLDAFGDRVVGKGGGGHFPDRVDGP